MHLLLFLVGNKIPITFTERLTNIGVTGSASNGFGLVRGVFKKY
jgi:hypothetical protein